MANNPENSNTEHSDSIQGQQPDSEPAPPKLLAPP
jgi:hypothetical protein